MGDDGVSIRVNFKRRFPVFPLDSVVLLPHSMLWLYMFEPRYRQLAEDCLDSSGQFAMAVFEGTSWQTQYSGLPPIGRAVCVAQIQQHHKEPSGNHRILIQGVCRGRIVEEFPPEGDLLYRQARIEPIEPKPTPNEELLDVRQELMGLIEREPLHQLMSCRRVTQELSQREVPTAALMEVVTLAVLNDKKIQYRLLDEADVYRRAGVIGNELRRLEGVLEAASRQWDPETPKGLSWN